MHRCNIKTLTVAFRLKPSRTSVKMLGPVWISSEAGHWPRPPTEYQMLSDTMNGRTACFLKSHASAPDNCAMPTGFHVKIGVVPLCPVSSTDLNSSSSLFSTQPAHPAWWIIHKTCTTPVSYFAPHPKKKQNKKTPKHLINCFRWLITMARLAQHIKLLAIE